MSLSHDDPDPLGESSERAATSAAPDATGVCEFASTPAHARLPTAPAFLAGACLRPRRTGGGARRCGADATRAISRCGSARTLRVRGVRKRPVDSRLRGNDGWGRSGRRRADYHSRESGNDGIDAGVVIPAKAGIHDFGQPQSCSAPYTYRPGGPVRPIRGPSARGCAYHCLYGNSDRHGHARTVHQFRRFGS